MKKLLTAVAAFGASTIMFSGGAMAATINNTGPRSHNKITIKNMTSCTSKNNNNLNVLNLTKQKAKSGNATVKHNTTGGDASTGDAMNEASSSVSAGVSNASACGDLEVAPMGGGGSIDTTGPRSTNVISHTNTTKVTATNNNNLNVMNMTVQSASTGNANVHGNTTGGDASTGDASNSNMTSTSFSVSNN